MNASDPSATPPDNPSAFAPTRWTLVLRARGRSPEAEGALSELCEGYYAPVLSFIRRSGCTEDAARDLAQEFFARLLAKQNIQHVDPDRGRFRFFLLGAVRHFLNDMRDHERRLKRGGGQPHESLDSSWDTSPTLQLADITAPEPDREFDRKWALAVLDRALAALAKEHLDAGKSEQFEVLKPWLAGDSENMSQADAAERLGMNEGAVKVAIHRLRRRFRELTKSEIAETVANPAMVDEEMRHLVEALVHG